MSPPSSGPGAAPFVIAIAASAGGLAALSRVLSALPAGIPAPILVVQHLDPGRRSDLAYILRGRTPLRVVEAAGGERLEPGTVYVAPPDRHLLVNADWTLALSEGARIHFSRPSADALFRSVAATCGVRCIGVVLTGRLSDGSDGVRTIHDVGGTVIVQDPATAEQPGMPHSAIGTGVVDRILPLEEIAPALLTLARDHDAE